MATDSLQDVRPMIDPERANAQPFLFGTCSVTGSLLWANGLKAAMRLRRSYT